MDAVDQAIAEYPFLTPRAAAAARFKTEAAFAASNIRALLKHNFPNTRFSVKSETYSGGDSVYISWADLPGAPREEEVYGLVGRFRDGLWDGIYKYRGTGQGFRDAFGGVNHVFARQRCPTAAEVRDIPKSNVDTKDEFGCTLLFRILVKRDPDNDVLKALIDLGPDPNAGRDAHGATLLMIAARNGRRDIVKELLRLGADISLKDFSGRTAQSMAVENGHTETAGLLCAHALSKTLETVPSSRRHDFGAPEPLERIDRPARRRL